MKREELAARLAVAEARELVELIQKNISIADVRLAKELQVIFYEAWTNDTQRVFGAAAALRQLSSITKDAAINAYAEWGAGISALVQGELEKCIEHLNESENQFIAAGQTHTAATTRIGKLYALALLGRYDDAIDCGLKARDVFVDQNDFLSAGKVEHNIGNIYARRDLHRESEDYFKSARERFLKIVDQRQLIMVENCLANARAEQNDFREAESLYKQAVARAENSNMTVTQAEIESNLGKLYLYQCRYDLALDCFERSRRKYASLRMPHRSAIAEMEIADIYLEINLLPEAAEIYKSAINTFDELGMRAERARCLLNYGRTLLSLSKEEGVEESLSQAEELFQAEGNAVAAAVVKLTRAQALCLKEDYDEAERQAEEAEREFISNESQRYEIVAKFLRGEVARLLENDDEASLLLKTSARLASEQSQTEVLRLCLTSLGKLSVREEKFDDAENYFKQAVKTIESSRALLSADEMRTAFFADKLAPYDELIRLCLADERTSEAFQYLERSRSRSLFDTMNGALITRPQPRDEEEAALLAKLDELREELNWFYSRINRNDCRAALLLSAEAKERERAIVELERKIQHRTKTRAFQLSEFDIEGFQSSLDQDTAFVEYASIEDEIVAFVVTKERIEFVCCLASNKEIAQFLFQIKTMRFGSGLMERHKQTLLNRAMFRSRRLYDALLRPLESLIEERQLVIAPFRSLHYLPFHALHDGERYAIERREISYAPSAAVWLQCQSRSLSRASSNLQRALFVGVADERTPLVREEISSLSSLFESSKILIDEQATVEALKENSSDADVLHIACHGHFRPDNPLFSSLGLHEGRLTVRDIYHLSFQGSFVALSACETALNSIVAGEELIGLARGFLSIGASSLLLTLWTVNDEAAARLMKDFYENLRAGETAASALRTSQRGMLKTEPHPYYWSPFVLIGQ
jgi:CHAT domain-containing protein/predicted negative regulator of RcsB-dependent stress response